MLILLVLRKAEDSLGNNTLLVLWAPKSSAPFLLWFLL